MGQLGSYSEQDVILLLKNINGLIEEKPTEYREQQIQAGSHYSEMLPVEYVPGERYMSLFKESLERTAEALGQATATLAHQLMGEKGKRIVLVSLARAGIPAGILLRRYFKVQMGLDLPHYGLSIIRGRGIDTVALDTLCKKHSPEDLLFVDGWTGKGAIIGQLKSSIDEYNQSRGTKISPELAVLADPGDCADWYGTKEDFLIPSSLLNATVSGLLSRTVLRKDLIGEQDYHGVKVYDHLRDQDLSYEFIETVVEQFSKTAPALGKRLKPQWQGMADVKRIQDQFDVGDINLIKPGIGETTRVLLRRVPWKVVLADDVDADDLDIAHVLELAKEKSIEVVRFPLSAYRCCGIIKAVKGDLE